MIATRDQINHIVESLYGTGDSVTQAFLDVLGTEYVENEIEILEEIDNQIFCCDSCGWWLGLEQEEESDEEGYRKCGSCCDA